MEQTYLSKNGEVVNKHFKEIKEETGKNISWEAIHTVRVERMAKEERDFLKKYGLKPTIFNVSNLREWGYVHLTEHFIKVVLENGAVDKRGEK